MIIKDVLQRDPTKEGLVNQGQARIVDTQSAQAMAELRGELSTFVCEGQYAEGVQKIIRSFIDNLGRTSQRAAWVSGFFGSGKSHILKMLCHLWRDTEFPDGATARSLIPAMPDELQALLRELDTAGKRSGGLVAAAGSLLSGTTDNVRLSILSVLLKAVGLPSQYPQAQFCLWLHAQGYYDQVRHSVESAGKDFKRELNNLYVSDLISRALISCNGNFANSEAEAKQLLRAQYPRQSTDITTEEFILTIKNALRLAGKDGRLPCTVLVLDEVQQYIGESTDRSVLVTEVAEALSKQLDSHVMVVASGQSALTDQPLLQKLLDRFTIRVPLSDVEVETVTRKVLLQKKPAAVAEVQEVLSKNAGEISRQLHGTSIAERTEDHRVIVEDYPLLPVRRRFWEQCFRQIDAAGTHSQLRSQLQIIHDAVEKIADKPLGTVVPADELYESLAPEMINTGVLLREINERIIELGKSEGPLARRVCGLVFLINKVSSDDSGGIGVQATKEHIADLLVDDLTADNGKLRKDVEQVLDTLVANGALLKVGDEYRIQTPEGSEWDAEFRNRQTKLRNDEAAIQYIRDRLLYAEVEAIVKTIKPLQGTAKEARTLSIHRDQTPPQLDGQSIPVWIRDGWSCQEKEHVEAARKAGPTSPTIAVFIPRQSANDLKRHIIEAEAAQRTLDVRGNPTTPPGQEARQSMESRRARSELERDRIVLDIISNAKVFQGGGSECLQMNLNERLREAATDSMIRLFPRFKEADSGAWPAVIKRARDGADHPFEPVGHTDATEKYQVCQQVIATIGAGKTGTDIRKELKSHPFGWPQDAIDAAIIALHRLQHISATLNQTPLTPGELNQNKIARTEFRVVKEPLSVQDRLVLRKLYGKADIACKSGEEEAKASALLIKLKELAQSAGGQPPLPAPHGLTEVEDLEKLVGNAQLVAIKDKATELEQRIDSWKELRERAQQRQPLWDLLSRLVRHAQSLEEAKQVVEQMEAIQKQRLLLDTTDHVSPLLKKLAELLRSEVARLYAENEQAYSNATQELSGNDSWTQLSNDDKKAILSEAGLTASVQPSVKTDEDLAAHLDSCSLASAKAEIDAVAGRASNAIQRAAKKLEPQVQTVKLERSTLRNEADFKAWVERQAPRILEALKQGPVLID